MDPALNPFVPGAGTQPAKLAGRDDLLERTEITLNRVKNGKYSKSFIVVGLRGVGKTVILGQVYERATNFDYHAMQIEAHEDKSLPALLVPKFRQVLIELDFWGKGGSVCEAWIEGVGRLCECSEGKIR